MNPVKILFLTKYSRIGASSRMRLLQYLPLFQQADIQCTVQSLLSNEMLLLRYQSGKYPLWHLLRVYLKRLRVLSQCHQFNLIWIEKEALQWFPVWIELAMLRGIPYVLDYDDAIFHNYDQHPNPILRGLYGYRIDRLMAKAILITCGNNYLADRARNAGAAWVEVLPTVIDLKRYPRRRQETAKSEANCSLRIAWIGSPATVCYLHLLNEPLLALAEGCPFVLRMIGGGRLNMPGVQVEIMPWSEDTEVESISGCDLGVMPLHDTPWERGKCGYKLIQYMACGLPIIASPIGVNCDIVDHGVNGFLAGTQHEWIQALQALLNDAELRKRMGQAGRRKVEQCYSLQATAPRMAALLKKAAGKGE